jgi:hypothetical protein
MKTQKQLIKKQKSNAFGKDIYLFGVDTEGKKYWLESPEWDCGWYWGFGYIETYTNNSNPSKSRDIQSHQHFSGFVGSQENYNFEKQCFVKGEYIHNVWDNGIFAGFTFDEKIGWNISELFKQFYLLKEMSDFCHKKPVAGCNLTTVKDVDHGDMTELYDKINKEMIPKITAKILEYLSPE